jgi:anti-sigma factor RsiW
VETAELTHEEVRAELSDYLDGELDEAQRSRIAGHLARCSGCAAHLATLRRTVDLLGSLPPRVAPQRLRDRLQDIPAAPSGRSP